MLSYMDSSLSQYDANQFLRACVCVCVCVCVRHLILTTIHTIQGKPVARYHRVMGEQSSHASKHVCVAHSGHWGVSWASSVLPAKTGIVPQSGHNFTNHSAIWHCTIFNASQCLMLCSCVQHYPMCQSFLKCPARKHNATTSHTAH
jgi:hypothetical protein